MYLKSFENHDFTNAMRMRTFQMIDFTGCESLFALQNHFMIKD